MPVTHFSRGKKSSLSSAYIRLARDHCLSLLRQAIWSPLAFVLPRAGRSRPASSAMMAIVTSNSIRVKPRLFGFFIVASELFLDDRRRLPQCVQFLRGDL